LLVFEVFPTFQVNVVCGVLNEDVFNFHFVQSEMFAKIILFTSFLLQDSNSYFDFLIETNKDSLDMKKHLGMKFQEKFKNINFLFY
jgi:hypothetical protein